ncbi:MAG: glycosyltransferase family 2 protein [Clostridiales bacterium]|nr:glycosyltransferase family 2 protein [Clostridiales bacterium]
MENIDSISVVIPCYKSDQTIAKVVALTKDEFRKLNISNYQFVLVNDCSPDNGKTISQLKTLAQNDDTVTVIDLARNAGQHNAVMAGLNYAAGDYILCMDDDMQTHPSQIKILLNEILNGYDVVYGFYPEKKHNKFRNIGSKINYLTVRLLIGKPKSLKSSSFFIMKSFIKDYIINYNCSYSYLPGLVLRTTKNISCVPVKHFEREVGKSGYTFKALLKLYSNILGFSVVPLKLCTYCGYIVSGLSMLGAVVVLIEKLFVNTGMAMGWPSTIIIICFMFGLSFIFLGLIGEYIGRMFMSSTNTPQYVIREVYHGEEK